MRRVMLMTAVLCAGVALVAAGACAASTWYTETVDTADHVGTGSSLAVDASGYPRISYSDNTNEDLKYAVWTGGNWDIRTVDAGAVGGDTSLELDADGYPHISYQDHSADSHLKYAFWNGSSWVFRTVDSAPSVGFSNSLALDRRGYPNISYGDDDSGDLKYAFWNGSSWVIRTVDSADSVGGYTSLALDPWVYPHISYYDWTNDDLKYAVRTSTAWEIQTVDSAGDVGRDTSLALAALGRPRISYYDATNGDLKYAAWKGTTWEIQTVDSAGSVGRYSSVALDPGGHAHISYYDATNGDLKYAAWNGSSWDIETVDSEGSVGAYTCLALDAGGYAHIAYYDWTNADLKYATTHAPAHISHELPTAGYYMISFPLTPSSAAVHDLLCDDLGCGNYYMWGWRAGGYQPVSTSAPGCQAATLSTQEGYWILNPPAMIGMGGLQPITDEVIPLQSGWNMVAAPHEATMDGLQVDNAGDVRSLADAEAANWVLATFYGSHDGSGSYRTLTINQTPAEQLSLWHGYWVLAGLDCSLIVPLSPPAPPAATTGRAATARPAWTFDIRATSASFVDTITIAAADSASEDFDGFALDKPKPPAAPGEGRLRMVLREGWRGTEPPPYNKARGRQMAWRSELAMEAKGAAPEATEWQFTVSGGVEGEPVTLSWPHLSRLPKDRVAILTDRDTGKRTFMRTRAQYQFSAPGEDSGRSFTVTVKPVQAGALLISGLSASPTRGGTWDVAFNLSADAAVTARIYNVAGRRVADIARGSQLAPGPASLTWNARSVNGARVPSGSYLLRITARTEAGEQASAVTLLQVTR